MDVDYDNVDVDKLVDEAPDIKLDAPGLRKMVTKFEKRIQQNQEMRLKFADQPDKFMESEMELDESLQQLRTLAAFPTLYGEFVRLQGVALTVSLLSHDNTDIAIDAVQLMNDLVDAENQTDEEGKTAVENLVEEMLTRNVLELLVQNLARLDEKNENDSQCVYNSMSVIENLIEWKETVREDACETTDILNFLITRIGPLKQFDANKQYASELLAIILQNCDPTQEKFVALNGMEKILQSIAHYKKRDPKSPDEEELIENLFDTLCTLLMRGPSQDVFRSMEGIDLMILIMKNKKYARKCAVKALDFALQKNRASCEWFVDRAGLGAVFGAFLKKGSGRKRKGYDEDKDEEHVLSILVSLLNFVTGIRRERLMAKFVESDYAKVERLVELHEKYVARVTPVDAEIDEERREAAKYGEEIDGEMEEEFYMRRLDAGLFTLQLVDLVVAHACTTILQTGIRVRMKEIMHLRNLSLDRVVAVLQEYLMNIGEIGAEQQNELKALIAALTQEAESRE